MKKIFLFTVFVSILCNCHQPVEAVIESKKTVVVEVPKYDSITQKTAYKSMLFGLSKKEFLALSKKNNYWDETIGNHNYYFSYFFDQKDELYFIQLKGMSKDATYLETTVQEEASNLIQVLTKKFGDPIIISSYPSILQLNSGKIRVLSKWDVGNKKITVGVGEEQNQAEFYSCCWIVDSTRETSYLEFERTKGDIKQTNDASNF